MNLNQLRVFHAVVQLGSMSAAARQLGVSQPAISKQLAELEASLGAPLLDRLPRGIRMTPVGRALQDHAVRLFAAERAAELEMASLTGTPSARLSVGASTTIGSYLVPTVFGALRRLYPQLGLSLAIGNTATVAELVQSDRVDLGLTEGLAGQGDLISEPFAEDELVAVASPADDVAQRSDLTLDAFLERPFIARERGSGTRDVLEAALAARGRVVSPVMELGSSEAVKNAVAARLGVAFVSSLAVELEVRSGRLSQLNLVDFSIRRALHVVELKHRVASPILNTLKELLRAPHTSWKATEYAI